MRRGRLRLEDGSVFEGVGFGATEPVAGEVVFSTGMVGYPESLTDPSYAGQILVLNYPLVGNYGVPAFERDAFGLPHGFESERIQAAGLVVWEHSERYSHARAARSLDDWLRAEGIPALAGVDTRAVTKLLRSHGTMLGAIEAADPEEPLPLLDPNATDLVASVSDGEVIRYDSGGAGAAASPSPTWSCGSRSSGPSDSDCSTCHSCPWRSRRSRTRASPGRSTIHRTSASTGIPPTAFPSSAPASPRANLFGFAVLEMYWVTPYQRPGRGRYFGFQLSPGL